MAPSRPVRRAYALHTPPIGNVEPEFRAGYRHWKDLASHTAEIPARGCAGTLTDYSRPEGSPAGKRPAIETPNIDVLDSFAR